MNRLTALRDAAPAWAVHLGSTAEGADFIAAPPLPSGAPVAATILRVVEQGGELSVSERQPGERLPVTCPELHIVGDSSFCLGINSHRTGSETDARRFWQALGEFLVNQHHAARRGRWPVGRWLSHGPIAARRQLEAEALAGSMGVAPRYADCLENDEGWIADLASSRDGRIPISAPCPIGCRDGSAQPASVGSCGHFPQVRRIVAIERERRAAQDSYYRMLKRNGGVCCGRVPGCPMAERIAA